MTSNDSGPTGQGDLVANRYRIESVIGTGGMATVYRATDEELGRVVALKIFRTDVVDAASVRRQAEEIRLLASLDHPALVTLYDAVPAVADDPSSRGVLVMQYIEGQDLRGRLAAEGPLPSAAVAAIGADIAAALAYVHGAGVIHRDISPANVLLPAAHGDGANAGAPVARLADFGIARLVDSAGLTSTGTVIGTATYLSPEQARGAQLTPASDIYSLGLVLLEALTGERAFPGTAVESVMARLAGDPEIADDLSPDWRELLAAMTDREPTGRPDAAAVQSRLRDLPAAPELAATKLLPAVGATEMMPVDDATELMPAAGATELLPTAGGTELLPAAGATAVLPPAGTERISSTSPIEHPTRPNRAVIVIAAVVAALLVVAVVVALTGLGTGGTPEQAAPAETPVAEQPAEEPVAETPVAETPATPPAPDYPAVDGPLGDSLAALQQSVADEGIPEDLRAQLQDAVLGISNSAAAGDFEGGRDLVESLTDTVEDSDTLTGQQSDAIEAAADRVDRELEAAAKAADKGDKPGNGNGTGPGNEPGNEN